MKSIFTTAILAHSVLAGGDGPTTEQRIAGNGVAEKRHVVVNNIMACVSAYKTHAVSDDVTVMKTACSCVADTVDSGVDMECTAVKTSIKEFAVATGECTDATVANCADDKTTAIIEEMLLTNPRLLAKINSVYPVDYSSVNGGAAAVEAIIGTNTEDIKEYRTEQAADDIAKAIDICRRTRAGSLKPPLPDAAQSVKTAYNDAAPKSAAQKKTCSTTLDAGGEVAGRTDVKEAYELVKGVSPDTVTDADVQAAVFDAADKLIAEEATKCSKDNKPSAGGTNDKVTTDTARKDCVDALTDRYEAITGKSMDEAGLKNVLSKGAAKEVGYEVKACVDSIASTVTGTAKALAGKVCRTGDAAKKALAEAMGRDAADITDTDVVKATREGAKEVGVAAIKAGKTLTEAGADIAAAIGKLTGSACEAKATWTKDCLTKIDVKKMIEKEAGECMKTSIASCKQVAVDVATCGATSLAVKADLDDCRGASAVELTDTDVKKMEKKSNSRDIVFAIKNRASGTSKEDGEYCLCFIFQFFSKQWILIFSLFSLLFSLYN